MDNNLLYKIALTQIEGVGPVLAKNLVSYCGGVKEIFQQTKRTLSKIPGVGLILADEIKKDTVFKNADKILQSVTKNNIGILFYLDNDYPSRLKHINDGPVLLYYQGTRSFNAKRTLGIVGTRNATIRGKAACDKIINELKDYDVTIVSGLAFGIDAAAHRAAIKYNLPNIGIMGNGIDITYPSQHQKLRSNISLNGDILSEFPLDTKPDKGHFPMRNRIIAGLSDALLVVESDIKGGSMITARMAFDYNKDVFAIPGRIEDKYSRGTNSLIKNTIAYLTENAGDIARMMNWTKTTEVTAVQMQMFAELDKNEQKVFDILKNSENESMSVDEIHHTSQFTMGELASILLNLELKGMIENMPGARYTILRK